MKSKIISWLVISSIVLWTTVAMTNANDTENSSVDRNEIRELFNKIKSGETLSADEKAILDEYKPKFWNRENWNNFWKKGRNGMMKGITDEEKEALADMTDEEKQEFFAIKKAERNAEIEAKKLERKLHEAVIDKLLLWETLTDEEEDIRASIIEKRNERKIMRDIMEKVRSWEELSTQEQELYDNSKGVKYWFWHWLRVWHGR